MEAKIQSPPTKEDVELLERVARVVSSIRGTKPDYAGYVYITKLAVELELTIPFDVFGIVLLRHDRQAVRVTVCARDGNTWSTQYHQHPLGESKLEQVLQDPLLMVHNYPNGVDGPPAESGDALSGCPHLRATLIAPLIVGDRVLGTLELGSTVAGVYDDTILQRVIRAIVHILAAAIESVQVGGSVEIQDRQRQALKHVSSALTSQMDLPMILNQIVMGMAEALHVASAILTVDQRGDEEGLHLEAASGLDLEMLRKVVSQEANWGDQYIIGYSLRRHQPCVSHDIANDERFPGSRFFASQLAMRSIFSYPLVIGEKVYGALLLCSPEPGGFTPLKTDIFSLFASQAALAIHHGLLQQAALLRGYAQEFPAEDTPGRAGLPGKFSTIKDAAGKSLVDSLTQDMVDAWFVVDLDGHCIYINPVAEMVCGMHMATATTCRLEEVFAGLLLRVRNVEELQSYLQDFSRGTSGAGEEMMTIRSVFASEAVQRELPEGRILDIEELIGSNWQERAMVLENAVSSTQTSTQSALQWNTYRIPAYSPSDQHYQLMRIPFYNTDGELLVNALRMHDITGQVRDEKNKAVLLSSVSHDLRTPLTSIKAAVTGLLQPDVDWDEEARREILEEIDAETDHLSALVNSLVEMSRIEMGALVLEKEWCDVVEVVHATLSRLQRILDGRPVRTQCGDRQNFCLPLISADFVQLGRVFHNLIENAARYSPPGTEIRITLDVICAEGKTATEAGMAGFAYPSGEELSGTSYSGEVQGEGRWALKEGTEYLRARVIDYGNGVPESERERIFKPFYSLNAQREASGLGLAICRGIVEAHGGHIWMEPLPGGVQGSCFVFVLPISAS